jgi:hypothetical protein
VDLEFDSADEQHIENEINYEKQNLYRRYATNITNVQIRVELVEEFLFD